jgi:hypothetical protein
MPLASQNPKQKPPKQKPIILGTYFPLVFISVVILTVLLLASGITLSMCFPNPTKGQGVGIDKCFGLGGAGFSFICGLLTGKWTR